MHGGAGWPRHRAAWPHLDAGMAFSNSHEVCCGLAGAPARSHCLFLLTDTNPMGLGQLGDSQVIGRGQRLDAAEMAATPLPCGHPLLSEAVPMPGCCVAMLPTAVHRNQAGPAVRLVWVQGLILPVLQCDFG